MSAQDLFGGPQKSAPCGLEDPGSAPQLTGQVTTFTQGQTIFVTVNEVIPHPGHYRVVVAQNPAALPPDPPVMAGATPCGSAEITANPQLPVLADGMLVHTNAFTEAQSMEIALPPDFTCTECTLQVIEFMSNHGLNNPGGCYYHHCATISVVAGADADAGSGMDSSSPSASAAGCRCAVPSGGNGGPWWMGVCAGALALVVRRGQRSKRSI